MFHGPVRVMTWRCLCRSRSLWGDAVKAQAGDRHRLITARKGISLLLADPFGQTVGVFSVGWMLFVERKVIVVRPTTKYTANRVDARRLAYAFDTKSCRSAECVIAAHDIVVMDFVILMATWTWIGRQMHERIAPLHG